MTDLNSGFGRDGDTELDELLAQADDMVLRSVEAALDVDTALTRIFLMHPLRRALRPGKRRRIQRDRPSQEAIADQARGTQRP
ncbi:hypothetical protein [Streptomyces wuyuanensis]|uniref:hypothetical protein n=1 Tax=Streptomyces wuyuanensis TaxID=1196353 RepID=UPI003D7451A5